jgi:hypothetical protein
VPPNFRHTEDPARAAHFVCVEGIYVERCFLCGHLKTLPSVVLKPPPQAPVRLSITCKLSALLAFGFPWDTCTRSFVRTHQELEW